MPWSSLDCFERATPPKLGCRNWPSRIWSSCKTMHNHRVHCFRQYISMVNPVLGRKYLRNSEWPILFAKIWSDPLPKNKTEKKQKKNRIDYKIWSKTLCFFLFSCYTCKQMTSGSFWIISCTIRYLRDSQVKASAGQQTKLSLCWPKAVVVVDFLFQISACLTFPNHFENEVAITWLPPDELWNRRNK